MALATYDPPSLEIKITLALGLTVLSPYYRSFVKRLNLRGDERVLDFGSGSGICSRHIAARLKRGGHLDCVDISAGWMNVLRRTLRRYDNVSYHLGGIEELELPAASFDVVSVHFVLHDISAADRPVVMNALGSKLKSSGRLVLREPQGEGLTLEELTRLARNANLHASSVKARKIAGMAVYEASLKRNNAAIGIS